MRRSRMICMITVLVMAVLAVVPAFALDPSTLYNGCRGEEVRKMQQALINLGYLGGTADGIFGNKTEDAVRKFQKDNHLNSDGLAGKKTLELLYAADQKKKDPDPTPEEPDAGNLFSGNYKTLRLGSSGKRVKILQQALIKLNYLSGKADGDFGQKTQEAVILFQQQNSLSADGVAGKKTLKALESAVKNGKKYTPPEPEDPDPKEPDDPEEPETLTGKFFSGNYTTLRLGDSGARVKLLQRALIQLGYLSGSADGDYGQKTQEAVQLFQKQNNLTQDGTAGKKTLKALETAVKKGKKYTPPEPDTPDIPAPDKSQIQLLHWFNDIKPSLKNGNQLLIYDPSTGLSWTLKVLSRGRHCDCEPLTRADTETMVKAFGNKNTWNQKGVYVKLPSGVWTIGSTHDMPHLSGSNKDNGFDGHLCVHFLRDMEECKANDPNYGVSNQETIRALWKKISGQTIDY